jgi:hypothetical protein
MVRDQRPADIAPLFLDFSPRVHKLSAIASLEVQRIDQHGPAKQHVTGACGVARRFLIRRRVTGFGVPLCPTRGRYLPHFFHRVIIAAADIPDAGVIIFPERVEPLLFRISHHIESRSATDWPPLPVAGRGSRTGEQFIAPFFIVRKPEVHA